MSLLLVLFNNNNVLYPKNVYIIGLCSRKNEPKIFRIDFYVKKKKRSSTVLKSIANAYYFCIQFSRLLRSMHSCVRRTAPSPSARQAKRAVGRLYGNQDPLHVNENVLQER